MKFIFYQRKLKTKEDIIQYHRQMILEDNQKIITCCNDRIFSYSKKRDEYQIQLKNQII
jgi:hypothetical protein